MATALVKVVQVQLWLLIQALILLLIKQNKHNLKSRSSLIISFLDCKC